MRARMDALFVERELYLRSAGRVRFVRISRRAQQWVAGTLAFLLGAWLLVAGNALALQAGAVLERASLARQQAQLSRDTAAVSAFRSSSGDLIGDIARRQTIMERLVTSRLGPVAPAAPPATTPPAPRRISALPDRRTLAALARAQDALANHLAATFDARSATEAATLRRVGFDPAAIFAARRGAQGGPLLPLQASGDAWTPALWRLAQAVERWSILHDNLIALPSGLPTAAAPVTSSYGVRRDPFTGAPAFHAGLDFIGSYGQPICAAAPGRIVFVGQRTGYGNVVEIDHGHGTLTRYAHLSGADVRPGQAVERGDQIARMGSTGRSTGTHLHFEVQIDGNPVNPSRFLALSRETADVR